MSKITIDSKDLSDAIQALDDWITTYASEWCGEAEVKVAVKRIWDNGGTLSYVTEMRIRLEKVLKDNEAKTL